MCDRRMTTHQYRKKKPHTITIKLIKDINEHRINKTIVDIGIDKLTMNEKCIYINALETMAELTLSKHISQDLFMQMRDAYPQHTRELDKLSLNDALTITRANICDALRHLLYLEKHVGGSDAAFGSLS